MSFWFFVILIIVFCNTLTSSEEVVEVNVGLTGETNTVESQLVSPPFGKAFNEIYNLNAWHDIAKLDNTTIESYNPTHGKFGIALAMVYGARNARLAIQHYSKASTLILGEKNFNEIWNDIWEFEYKAFTAFHSWNTHGNKQNWINIVKTIKEIYFDADKLSNYKQYVNTDEFNDRISVRLYKNNNVGMKTFMPTFSHVQLLNGNYNGKSPMIKLSNGYEIPLIGFGSWPLTGDECYKMLQMAIKNGYRLIDTSENYNNEEIIGKVIADSGLDRKDIFIADKISFHTSYGKEKTREIFEEQLKKLGVDYIDLYMIHGAIGDQNGHDSKLMETWAVLEDLYLEGKIKAIGVSNYDLMDMKHFMKYARVLPAFVQNKFDVFTQSQQAPWLPSILQFAQEKNILVQGYGVLNSWPHQIPSYFDQHVKYIAKKYPNKTPAQVAIRWALENGISILVRSQNNERQLQNLDVFDFKLDLYDKQLLNGLITLFSPYDLRDMTDVYEQLIRPE